MGIGHLILKNIALVSKRFWCFRLEADSLWHKVICRKHGYQQKVRMSGLEMLPHIQAPGNSYLRYLHISSLFWHIGLLREDLWIRETLFSIAFPCLYCASNVHNVMISCFYTLEVYNINWYLSFFRNLNERKTQDLNVLFPTFHALFKWDQIEEWRECNLEGSSDFSWRSFLSQPSTLHFSLAKFIRKSRFPS